MTKLRVYDIDGKVTGEVPVGAIPEDFQPNETLIARSLKRQMANARIPCAHVKNRSEIHGGGRKPWRQKGTGRSRQGSIRSIQWRGGAVAFGPQRDRNYKIGMNKKERKAALRQLIQSGIRDGDWLLFEDLGIDKPSTKRAKAFIRSLKREGNVLLLLPKDEKHENVRRSMRNITFVKILPPERLNTYDLLNADTVLAHREAFETVQSTWQV